MAGLQVPVVYGFVRFGAVRGKRPAYAFHGLGSLVLERELCSLEQTLQPPQDLGMRQRQLLQRPVADLGSEIVQLLEQLGRQSLAQFLGYLRMHPAKVVEGCRLVTDPPRLLEDLSDDPRDPQQSLGIQGESGCGDRVLGLSRGRRARRGLVAVHERRVQGGSGMVPGNI
jgi:hypothetical protein